jgi:hypothetical protein
MLFVQSPAPGISELGIIDALVRATDRFGGVGRDR